uniref:Uncharacterized protein n=1 Tax=Anguilla anguilla TaxID=7936 RepID=A0A0E9SKK5_ANGAN
MCLSRCIIGGICIMSRVCIQSNSFALNTKKKITQPDHVQ